MRYIFYYNCKLGAQRLPGTSRRKSYVYPSVSNNDMGMNRDVMYGVRGGNTRERGNIGKDYYMLYVILILFKDSHKTLSIS